MEKRRARSAGEKDARRAAIVDAADRLFALRPYGEISAEDIAREAGLSKASLFFYFSAKEEVFLALARRLFEAFFADARAFLSSLPPGSPTGALVEGLAGLIGDRPSLLPMMSILDAVVERNVSIGTLGAFKRSIAEGIGGAAALAARRYPCLAGDRGAKFFLWLYGIARGFHSLSEPGEAASCLIAADPALGVLAFDFKAEFTRVAGALIEGLSSDT